MACAGLASAVTGYGTRLRALLQHECSAEVAAAKTRCQWPRFKLQREGLALFDLTPRLMGAFHGYPIVRLYPQASQLPFHRLVFGDVVILSRDNPLSDAAGQGVVLNRSERWINIAVRRMPQGRQSLLPDVETPKDGKTAPVLIRVDSGWNEVAYERMEVALRTVTAAAGRADSTRPPWLLPLLLEHALWDTDAMVAGTEPRERSRDDVSLTTGIVNEPGGTTGNAQPRISDAGDAAELEQRLISALSTFQRPVLPDTPPPRLAHLVPKYAERRRERERARSALEQQLRGLAAQAAPNESAPYDDDAVSMPSGAQPEPPASSSDSCSDSATAGQGAAAPVSATVAAAAAASDDLTPEMEAEHVITTGLQVARLQRAWLKRFASGAYRYTPPSAATAEADGASSDGRDGTGAAASKPKQWFKPTGLASFANTMNLPDALRRDGGPGRAAPAVGTEGSWDGSQVDSDEWVAYDAERLESLDGETDPYADKRKRVRFRGEDSDRKGARHRPGMGASSGSHEQHQRGNTLADEEAVAGLEPEVLTFRMPAAATLSASDMQAVLSSLDHLNASQRAAIVVGLTSRVTCLQGPPGTGKTKTAAHLVAAWREVQRRRSASVSSSSSHAAPAKPALGSKSAQGTLLSWKDGSQPAGGSSDAEKKIGADTRFDAALAEVDALHTVRIPPGGPVLAVASSNVAVDQLLENFLSLGLRAVRVGDVVRVRPELRVASVEACVAAHPAMDVVRRLVAEAEELTNRLARIAGTGGKSSGRDSYSSSSSRYSGASRSPASMNPSLRKLTVAPFHVLAGGPPFAVARLFDTAPAPPSPVVAAGFASAAAGAHRDVVELSDGRAERASKLRSSATDSLISTFRGIARDMTHSDLSMAALRLLRSGIQEMLGRAARIERELAVRVVREADVVCSTATGAGHELLRGLGVNLVLLDESSQIREPEMLIPLARLGGPDAQLVLIGDDRQLPPVVHSPHALPLRVSLFERLLRTALPPEPQGRVTAAAAVVPPHAAPIVLATGATAGEASNCADRPAADAAAADAAAVAARVLEAAQARRSQLSQRIRAAEVTALAVAYGGPQMASPDGSLAPELLQALGLPSQATPSEREMFYLPPDVRVEAAAAGPAASAAAAGAPPRPGSAGGPSSALSFPPVVLPPVESLRCVPVARVMLNLGYRMQPAIAAWPNWALYGSRIRDAYAHAAAQRLVDGGSSGSGGTSVMGAQPGERHEAADGGPEGAATAAPPPLPPLPAPRSPPPGFPWPYQLPVAFVPVTDGKEQVQSDNRSRYNAREAEVVVQVVRALLKWRPGREKDAPTDGHGPPSEAGVGDHDAAGLPVAAALGSDADGKRRPLRPCDIGIVAPYAAQVRVISEALRASGFSVVEGSSHHRDDDDALDVPSDAEDEGWDEPAPASAQEGPGAADAASPTAGSSPEDDAAGGGGAAAASSADGGGSGTARPVPAAQKAARKASKARAMAYADNVEHGREVAEAAAAQRGAPAAPPAAAPAGTVRRSLASTRVIEVRSVDGFQGREKRVMLVSATRSNKGGSVGFLADYRRLNVALTRARDGLVVVGDHTTLSHDEVWESWLGFIADNDLVVPAALVPRR